MVKGHPKQPITACHLSKEFDDEERAVQSEREMNITCKPGDYGNTSRDHGSKTHDTTNGVERDSSRIERCWPSVRYTGKMYIQV